MRGACYLLVAAWSARAWLARTPAPPEGEVDQRYTPVALAVVQLEQALSQAQSQPPLSV